jgi:hypothetical protein
MSPLFFFFVSVGLPFEVLLPVESITLIRLPIRLLWTKSVGF